MEGGRHIGKVNRLSKTENQSNWERGTGTGPGTEGMCVGNTIWRVLPSKGSEKEGGTLEKGRSIMVARQAGGGRTEPGQEQW